MKDALEVLIPKPIKVKPADGSFKWSGQMKVVLEPGNEDDRIAAETLVEACDARRLAKPVIVDSDGGRVPAKAVILAGDPCRHWALLQAMREEGLTLPANAGDEGYVLRVTPSRILIAANSPAGVYYGIQTLIQLLPATGKAGVPAVDIADRPNIRQRGISMDFGRGEVYTVEAVKADIRRIAHYKMNLLVLYLENAFLFPSHPDIGEDRDRITTADAQELSAYARRHHVELAPCLDSPGHVERMLSHPKYQYLREGDESDGLRMVIDVTNPGTYPLLRDLYADLCKAFPAPTFYMGGDEAVALGKGRSKPVADKVGAANLFLRHVREIRKVLADHGKRMVVWGDPFEPGFFAAFGMTNYGMEALHGMPRDVIIAPWHYGRMDSFEFGDKAKELGFDMHLWTSMGACNGIFPELHSTIVNVETYVPHAHRLGALGVVDSNWGDKNDFRPYNWPALAHFAEWAWEPKARASKKLLPLTAESFYGPGTESLADVLLYLSNTRRYFGWMAFGMEFPGFKAFFDPMEPKELNAERVKLLAAFRLDGEKARRAFAQARAKATRETLYLDYIDYALDQLVVMGDIVECRHLLAKGDAKRREMLTKLTKDIPALFKRYEALWHRERHPRGLEQNRRQFAELIESIKKALAGLE